MAEHSKERVRADAAFLKTQKVPRDHNASEADVANRLRDEKTADLRKQRLNKEALDEAAIAAASSKRKLHSGSKCK